MAAALSHSSAPTKPGGVEIARARMVANAKLFADEATHWDALEMDYAGGRINHSESYSDGHGKHTNWVESYFTRAMLRLDSGPSAWRNSP